jgi:ATP phosphoribosyltransferase regulatory subunit
MIEARRGNGDKLRIAVPKGALFADSVRVLGASGLDTGDLSEPGRRLVVETGDAAYIISKPTDVPVYVAYGAADCGIAGRDVLVEAGLEIVEMVDLGFGGCRFVVAGAEDSAAVETRYRRYGVLRVATKYPRIAQAYFDEAGIQVEIVKLNGNIELAPMIGIADVIVDITATGTTLRQNGLRILEEVLPSTARFICNPVAVRTDSRLVTLADKLCALSVESTEAGAGPVSDKRKRAKR